MNQSKIEENIQVLKKQIAQAVQQAGRNRDSPLILAVSKGQSIEKIRQVRALGIEHFAENYLQEATAKILALEDLRLIWHFIGPIQSKKIKKIARYFSWVHSIARAEEALLLNEFRPQDSPLLQVCVQVNLSDEKEKNGVRPAELAELLGLISKLPQLKLRGLMTLAPNTEHLNEARLCFEKLHMLLEEMNCSLNLKMDTLSMGMSNDLIQAIAAGSTLLRIGRAIFGERTP